MGSAPQWRSRPLFVTSTFRDMQQERDHLVSVVFPALEEKLRARFHHLEPIDLRVGVEIVSVDQERARELLVLKVCLDEIERSRPFLIALLGDRYGWIPPEERMQAAAQEVGFQADLRGKSITALEIEFGVLGSADQKRRTHIYLRNPLPYNTMDPATAADYSDKHNPAPGAAEAWERQDALKTRLKGDASLAGRVHEYDATWDAKTGRVSRLDAWGLQVVEHVWDDLEVETREHLGRQDVPWQEQERLALQQFIEQRSRSFVGREDITRALLDLSHSQAAEGASWGMCMTGPPGSGKSALFAHVSRRLAEQGDVLVLANAPGAGTRSTRIDAMLGRWVDELAKCIGATDPLTDDSPAEEINERFREFLSRAERKQRVVVLIDALDQFEATTRAQYMTWLPEPWPRNARLIATAIQGTQAEAMAQRSGVRVTPLEPLGVAEAVAIAKRVYERYHRTPNSDVLRALMSRTRADGTLAAGNPLWLELALEELNLLDADDFARAERQYTGKMEERLHQLTMDMVRDLPPDVAGLYAKMLEKTEKVFGHNWARAFAEVITVSRRGWRELDLRVLLPRLSGGPWDNLKFASLRRGFRAHLVKRGTAEQWDFCHAQTREAVRSRSLGDPRGCSRMHAEIVDHLEQLPRKDPVRQSEIMFHCIGANDPARAAAALTLTLGHHAYKDKSSIAPIHSLSDSILLNGQSGIEWVVSLLDQPGLDASEVGHISELIYFDMHWDLHKRGSNSQAISLLEATATTLERIQQRLGPGSDPADPESASHLAHIYDKLGKLYGERGNPSTALVNYRRALALKERTRAPLNLPLGYAKVAQMCLALGQPRDALKYGQKALELQLQLHASLPPQLSGPKLAALYVDLGDVYRQIGAADSAARHYARALRVFDPVFRAGRELPQQERPEKQLGLILERFGSLCLGAGDLAGALVYFSKSHLLADALSKNLPDDPRVADDLAVALMKLGDAYASLREFERAQHYYARALTIVDRLLARDPDRGAVMARAMTCCLQLLHACSGRECHADALAYGQRALTIATQLQQRAPESPRCAEHVVRACLSLRDVCTRMNRPNEAAQYRQRCRELLQSLERGTLPFSAYLAGLRQKLERTDEFDGSAARAHPARTEAQKAGTGAPLPRPSDSLAGRPGSTVLSKIVDLVDQGQVDQALEVYRTSPAIGATLLPTKSAHDDLRAEVWRSRLDAANGLRVLGDSESAVEQYRAAVQAAEELVAEAPGDADLQHDLGVTYMRLGELRLAAEDASGAMDASRTCLQSLQRLCTTRPVDLRLQRNLAIAQSNVADVLRARGNLKEAFTAYRAALDTFERLVEQHPADESSLRALAAGHGKLGHVLRLMGDSGKALPAFQAELALFRRMAEDAPHDTDFQRGLATSHSNVADALLEQGNAAAALQEHQASLAVFERLAKHEPGNAALQRDLAVSFFRLAVVADQTGSVADCDDYSRRCYQTILGMKKAGMQLDRLLGELFEALVRDGVPSGPAELQAGDLAAAGTARSARPIPGSAASPLKAGEELRLGSDAAAVLTEVQRLLDEGKPHDALSVLNRCSVDTNATRNARAVCLMRMKAPEVAVDILRVLVETPNKVSFLGSIPATARLNLATALLMTGDVSAASSLLVETHQDEEPVVARLREVIAREERTPTLWQRVKWCLGWNTRRPTRIEFPPGQL